MVSQCNRGRMPTKMQVCFNHTIVLENKMDKNTLLFINPDSKEVSKSTEIEYSSYKCSICLRDKSKEKTKKFKKRDKKTKDQKS